MSLNLMHEKLGWPSREEIWPSFLWGNRRDWALIQDLNKLNTIETDVPTDNVRRGIVLGDRKKRLPHLKRQRILLDSEFPDGSFVRLSAGQLPSFSEPTIDSDDSIDFSAFALPQLIIKKSWRTDRWPLEVGTRYVTTGDFR